MRTLLTCLIALTLLLTTGTAHAKSRKPRKRGWLLANNRVVDAYKTKRAALKAAFAAQGLSYPASRVFIRIFKKERLLELWAAGAGGPYRRIRSYPVCAASGELGPKRQQGDGQVPEGFYRVRVFNPWSAFHLSMGIDYPNRSDRILGVKGRLGSAIMIHGACASIGCVAITDDKIKEVYLAAAEAYITGRRRPVHVHIFPTRLDAAGMAYLARRHAGQKKLLRFWGDLKRGFDHFEATRTLPRIRVDRRGRYVVITRGRRVATLRR
jgi:murein L,D-transpeptidase YafK